MCVIWQDDAMLFITVKTAEGVHVPKVLQVVEETKRIRHKAGACIRPPGFRVFASLTTTGRNIRGGGAAPVCSL